MFFVTGPRQGISSRNLGSARCLQARQGAWRRSPGRGWPGRGRNSQGWQGRGGTRGAGRQKWRPLLGRGALQNFGGAEIQNRHTI